MTRRRSHKSRTRLAEQRRRTLSLKPEGYLHHMPNGVPALAAEGRRKSESIDRRYGKSPAILVYGGFSGWHRRWNVEGRPWMMNECSVMKAKAPTTPRSEEAVGNREKNRKSVRHGLCCVTLNPSQPARADLVAANLPLSSPTHSTSCCLVSPRICVRKRRRPAPTRQLTVQEGRFCDIRAGIRSYPTKFTPGVRSSWAPDTPCPNLRAAERTFASIDCPQPHLTSYASAALRRVSV